MGDWHNYNSEVLFIDLSNRNDSLLSEPSENLQRTQRAVQHATGCARAPAKPQRAFREELSENLQRALSELSENLQRTQHAALHAAGGAHTPENDIEQS